MRWRLVLAALLVPERSGAFVGRVVFTALRDRLLDAAPDLRVRPELATAWAWEDGGRMLRLTLRADGILDHSRALRGLRARMSGFEPSPDGLIRLSGLRLPPG